MILRNWRRLINTQCVVARVSGMLVYPIYKNASTNLIKSSDRLFVDNEINELDLITVFIRDPVERFITGLNTYCRNNNLEFEATWQKVRRGELLDRHFAPQWIWLFHLYKYYRGKVILKSMFKIDEICKLKNISYENRQVIPPKQFVEIDKKIMMHFDVPLNLSFLISEYKHVLS